MNNAAANVDMSNVFTVTVDGYAYTMGFTRNTARVIQDSKLDAVDIASDCHRVANGEELSTFAALVMSTPDAKANANAWYEYIRAVDNAVTLRKPV